MTAKEENNPNNLNRSGHRSVVARKAVPVVPEQLVIINNKLVTIENRDSGAKDRHHLCR